MATIKHIFKGESLSMLFAFPLDYDMSRIQSHGVWIGRMEFTGVIIGQGIELKLTSLQTDLMSGNQRVSLWIDDTILGVRKPYVGDIAVGNTNALPDNESTSEVYDVIVNVDISVTSIEAGDLMFNYVKGVKGDPFLYSDFTPEQIAELQQPAADAIASIEAVELAVEQAEALRVQAESNRQTNTSTAISNAEQATDDANDAAILANEKAGLANNAALLANEKAGLAATATTQANTARDGANSAAQSANEAATNISPAVINNEQVQAETYNVLNARIAALESLIANGIFTYLQADTLIGVNSMLYKGAEIFLYGTAAPNIAPDFIGQFYINTTAGTTYQAKGIANAADWKQTSN